LEQKQMPTIQEDSFQQHDSTVAQPAPAAIPLWRNRDYWLLLSGQAVSSTGTAISHLAFPLLMLALTHSPVQAGLMTALGGLPYAIFCLPAGAFVDRWDRKRTMILCDIGRALALGSIPIALAFGHLTLIQLYLVSLVEGTLFVFFNLAEAAALPHVVTKEQLTTAIGQDQVLFSLAYLIGPSLGGLLYSFSRMLPFLSDALSYAVSVTSLFFIKTKFQETRTIARQKLWQEVKEGLVWLWHNPLVRFLAVLTCGLTTPCYGYALILILIAQQQHATVFTIGLIFASGAAGNLVGALLASPLEKRFGFTRVIIVSAWLWGILWLLYALAPNSLILGIFNGLSFTVVPIFTVAQYSRRLAATPDALQGRVNSVFRLISFGGQPLGLAVTGILLQAFGPYLTVFILFVPQCILAIAATVNKAIRQP
jgi:MFS family permease